jgi:hypothetical protein
MQGWYQLGGAIASAAATGLFALWLQGSQAQPPTHHAQKLGGLANMVPPAPTESSNLPQSGDRMTINGREVAAPWYRWRPEKDSSWRLGIRDVTFGKLFGGELRDTQNPDQQPIQWFAYEQTVETHLAQGSRYLDITQLAQDAGWHWWIEGKTLHVTTQEATVNAIRRGEHEWGIRWVLQFDRATPWQNQLVGRITAESQSQQKDRQGTQARPQHEWMVAVDTQFLNKELQKKATNLAQDSLMGIKVREGKLRLRLQTPLHCPPRIQTLGDPPRLVLDLGPTAMPERDMLWAPGIRWRQDWIQVGSDRLGVRWLEIDLKKETMAVKPIGQPHTQVGLSSLAELARQWQAYAAINGGFFNRNNYLPLGVVRRDGMWLSAPVLGRGAIGWNDEGDVKIAPLRFQETITTGTGRQFPVIFFNSGYVRAGIARYNRQWGKTYTPLTDGEILVIVRDHRVVKRHQADKAGEKAYQIPTDGYLLALRSFHSAASAFPVGIRVTSQRSPQPTDFNNYPHILGAGPILLRNGDQVLNASQESFSRNFAAGRAPRSVVGTTNSGKLLLAAIHYSCDRDGKAIAPNLETTAQIMQRIGAVDALNLDGGNSSTLYLGGRILNKSPRQTGRIHNGIGVFLENSPATPH